MTTLKSAERTARTIVNKWSAGAVAVGWIPGSTLALGAADYAMIQQVAEGAMTKAMGEATIRYFREKASLR